MAVKRKTDTVDQEELIEETLANQIPEAPEDNGLSEEDLIEQEIRNRVQAELERRKQEEQEPPQKQPVESMIGKKLTHSFSDDDHTLTKMADEVASEKHLSKLGENINQNVEFRDGWLHVEKELIGERAYYYPEDWEFYIKPASVDAIRNWSTVNEENPFNVSEVFNEILKYCLSIKTANGPQPWSAINVWDKLSFVLLIREYTFQQGEQNIQFTEDCVNCDSPVEFKLDSQALMFDMPDESVLRHYDRNTREWHIDPEEWDVPYSPITLYNPTLEKDMNIQSWLIERYQENKNFKPDTAFIRFLGWIAPKISKDSNIAKKQIKEYQMKYKSWDIDMFGFMDEVIKNIMVTPSQNLSAICPSCGEEVTAQIRFPNGISDLFNVRRASKRFGTK